MSNCDGFRVSLTFKTPDNVKYPSMDLAYAAGRAGGTMTGVLSAANEKAVEMFINEQWVTLLILDLSVVLVCWWMHDHIPVRTVDFVACVIASHVRTTELHLTRRCSVAGSVTWTYSRLWSWHATSIEQSWWRRLRLRRSSTTTSGHGITPLICSGRPVWVLLLYEQWWLSMIDWIIFLFFFSIFSFFVLGGTLLFYHGEEKKLTLWNSPTMK